jgi:hypothetical protein
MDGGNITMCYYTSLPRSRISKVRLVAWNRLWWECLHHGNGQKEPGFVLSWFSPTELVVHISQHIPITKIPQGRRCISPACQMRKFQVVLKHKALAVTGSPGSWTRALCMKPHCLSMHTWGNAIALYYSARLPRGNQIKRSLCIWWGSMSCLLNLSA